MPLTTWIALLAVALSAASLLYSRRDAQSKKTRDELDDLRGQIGGLQDRVQQLEAENIELKNENMSLLRNFYNCPAPECPLAQKPYVGPDRRTTPRNGLDRKRR